MTGNCESSANSTRCSFAQFLNFLVGYAAFCTTDEDCKSRRNETEEDEDLTNIVFINEIQGDGYNKEDYVELYNAGENEVNISNFVLGDSYNNDTQVFGDNVAFTLPQGSIIPPKGFFSFL